MNESTCSAISADEGTLEQILSATRKLIEQSLFLDAINLISGYLTHLRSQVDTHEWKTIVVPKARAHPVKALLDLDPLTNRCFTWPKGYQGDATTIDYIYYPELFSSTGIGKGIFDVTITRQAPSAVRSRKEFAKLYLTQKMAEGVKHFVSLGGGHLREWIELDGLDSEIKVISLDADQKSLQLAAEGIRGCSMEPIYANVISLIKGRSFPQDSECIYSLGLFDYLSDAIAKKLIARSFESLAPGGELCLANFSPNTADAGYIETYMNWFLIYRDVNDFKSLADTIPAEQIGQLDVWVDSSIVYMTIRKNI